MEAPPGHVRAEHVLHQRLTGLSSSSLSSATTRESVNVTSIAMLAPRARQRRPFW